MRIPRRSGPSGRSLVPLILGGVAASLLGACSGKGGDAPPPADTTPPTVPAGLTATPTSATSAALGWSASTDAVGVTGYEVLRDGAVVLGTASTTAGDTGLAPLTRYCWAVRALDAAGNRSATSPEACATTPGPPDLAPPAVVETTPAAGAADVAPTAVFTARFDEAVDPATLASGFVLRDARSAAVPATVTWDAPTLTATLAPSAPLEGLGGYTAAISTAVTDVAGNHVLAEVRWTVRVAAKALVLRRGAGGGFGAPCAPSRIAAADFDRDGHADVAFVCAEGNAWVARGDGAGGFAAATGITVGPRPGYSLAALNGVAAADLDGDGYPDLAVAEQVCVTADSCLVDGFVDVLLNRGATAPGSFGAAAPLGAGMYPMDVVAADLDGDGKVDLASVELWSNRLSVFRAAGGGAFAAAVPYDAADPVTLVTVALRPGGPIDLVPSGGPVLLGDGAGGFDPFAPATGGFAPGLYPMDIAAADLDRDGKADLVVANAAESVTVLLGDGTGAFPNPTKVQTGAYPGRVEAADLNGDGWPDLLVVLHENGGVGTNATFFLPGVGGGGFGPPAVIDGMPFAVADLDGDGRSDLVGTHLGENPFGFVLDAWLNDTP